MILPDARSDTPQGPDDRQRVAAVGKCLRLVGAKFLLDGVSYGPFAPNSRGAPFPEDEQLARDLAHIASLGFNTLRLYELPDETVLREAAKRGLRLLVGVPWAEHVDFLSDAAVREDVVARVRAAVARLAPHPQVLAFLVGNEIEKTLVRWMGPRRVRAFLERLISTARRIAPEALFAYATYPSTEYLVPRNASFLAVNVYLEKPDAWRKYLLRLQNLAGNKPLVITEHGLDAGSHGEQAQADALRWQRQALHSTGVAGGVWFSYTDEWQRGGRAVSGWRFGLVDAERRERPACETRRAMATQGAAAPARGPRFSVIVCTRNGSATLRGCLEAIERQSWPDREVLVIDDGSTDATREIASSFPFVRYHHQPPAGLGVARNFGLRLAQGEILAYTDDDCLPDEDWLARLATAFDDPRWVAAGGPNIPPPARNRTEALVASAPGAPTHVLLTDEEAEHLPGCNLAIRKSALQAIGGFHPDFHAAGDDVDVCWRLREAGGRLRFVPAAFVWHHRRFSVRAYLRQQSGYGQAEALLMKHHPSRFGPLGGARWRGAIYGDGLGLRDPDEGAVYHGPFGFAPFQAIYSKGIVPWWDLFAGVLWVALVLLALVLRQPSAALLLTLGAMWAAWNRGGGDSAPEPRTCGERLLLWLLCLAQPVVREWSRLAGMIRLGSRPSIRPSLPEIVIPGRPRKLSWSAACLAFWSEEGVGREAWLAEFRKLLAEKGIPFREDDGWRRFDLELFPAKALSQGVASVTEYHGGDRMLTRVRVLHRASRWRCPLWVLGAGALLWGASKLSAALGAALDPWLAMTVLAGVFVAVVFQRRLSAVNLVLQAGGRCGLLRANSRAQADLRAPQGRSGLPADRGEHEAAPRAVSLAVEE